VAVDGTGAIKPFMHDRENSAAVCCCGNRDPYFRVDACVFIGRLDDPRENELPGWRYLQKGAVNMHDLTGRYVIGKSIVTAYAKVIGEDFERDIGRG
jgi:hypothetical protein